LNARSVVGGHLTATPLAEVAGKSKPIDPELIKLTDVLAR
jgi:hypothetical protein